MSSAPAGNEAADADVIDRLYEGGDDPEGLGVVRALVARVRDEHAGAEPPQAISARLLQAAEEHAPRRAVAPVAAEEHGGLWARIRKWMMPATVMVAAAAGLVLYVQQDGKSAEPRHAAEETAREDNAAPAKKEAEVTAGAPAPTADAPAVVAKEAAPSSPPPPPPEAERKEKPDRKPTRGKRPAKDSGGAGGVGAGGESDRGDGDLSLDRSIEADAPVTVQGTVTGADKAPMEEPEPQPEPQQAPPPPSPEAGAADDEAPRTEQKQPQQKQKDAPPRTAVELTAEARVAAKKGDCKRVETLAAKVKALDATYYQKTFSTDADIRRCRK